MTPATQRWLAARQYVAATMGWARGARRTPEELQREMQRIADEAVISDVELYAEHVRIGCMSWCDVSPMLNPNELSPEILDLARCALQYGIARGLLLPHPERPELVRIVRREV